MKSILISIKPEWVSKILNGEKTIEIRKTAPRCDLPIDVYIYCTRLQRKHGILNACVKHAFDGKYRVGNCVGSNDNEPLNGKVVAKFTLRKINEYRCSVYIPEKGIALQHKVGLQSESDYPSNIANRQNWGWEGPKLKEILDGSCLSEKELALYLTNESNVFNGFYAWHIDDLVIFDRPKDLSEFGLTKVPQSWQYVEKIEWKLL